MSGGMVRRRMAHDRYKNKRMNTNPKKGPYHYTAPSRLFWKTVRGMLPHKTVRGAAAFERFKAYEGIPAPYDKVKRAVVPEALKVLRLGEGHRFCVLGDFCAQIGGKHVLGPEEGGERQVCRREEGGERSARRPPTAHRGDWLLNRQ